MQNCTWLVTAPKNFIVGYKFSDFDLGSGDEVELKDGKDDIAALLDNNPGQNNWLTSNGPYLRIRFISKNHYTFKGFRLMVKFFKDPTGNDL